MTHVFFLHLWEGAVGLGIFRCLATNWETRQMNVFLIFCKGYLELHVVIIFVSFDLNLKERTSR